MAMMPASCVQSTKVPKTNLYLTSFNGRLPVSGSLPLYLCIMIINFTLCIMDFELINVSLPSESPEERARDCQISGELFRNACQTMGELRDILRETGISWDFIRHEIDRANHRSSPLDKVSQSMDPYTTGPGKSLQGLPSNIF